MKRYEEYNDQVNMVLKMIMAGSLLFIAIRLGYLVEKLDTMNEIALAHSNLICMLAENLLP